MPCWTIRREAADHFEIGCSNNGSKIVIELATSSTTILFMSDTRQFDDLQTFKNASVPSDKIRLHWFGQLSFAIKNEAGTVVLVDPYFPHDRPAGRFIYPNPPLNESELHIDHVLLTHDHGDHTCEETLTRIRDAHPDCEYTGTTPSCERIKGVGVPSQQVHPITTGESSRLGTMTAHPVYAKPPRDLPEDGISAPDTEHLGYVVDTGSVRVYISGDPINTFPKYPELIDPIVALQPDLGIVVTHPTEGEFPFFAESAEMATMIGLKAVAPAHYECFTQRTYDPNEWSAAFSEGGPERIIIPYNHGILFP